jgi:type II secretory pathway pseudopilin PulG
VNLKFRNCKIAELQKPQRGYILLALMLAVAIAAIALLAVLPKIEQRIQREREEELQHRGTAYMRAIQHYYKKFGRYPTRVEELENTNQQRFLRKRYKDPMSWDRQTGKERDFKFLHQQDIHLNNGPLLGQPAGLGGLNPQGGPAGPNQPNGPGGLGQGNQLGGNQLSGVLPKATQTQPQKGEDDESDNETGNPQPSGPNSGPAASGSSSDSSSESSKTDSSAGSGFSGPVFGGGPIVGVASVSKAKSIREFDKKNHYNDWLFIYDPNSDRGGLLVGPWQSTTSGGLGGNGLGQPVQSLTQPGQGPGISQPFGGQPQGVQQNQQNQAPVPGDSEN